MRSSARVVLLAGLVLGAACTDDEASSDDASGSDQRQSDSEDAGGYPESEASDGATSDEASSDDPASSVSDEASSDDPASDESDGAADDADARATDAEPGGENSRDGGSTDDVETGDASSAAPDEVDAASATSDSGVPSDSPIDEALLEQLTRPAYPEAVYPAENPHTEAKALLGKILFWEEQMSGDGTVACGTCHRAAAGGSDPRAVHLPGPDELSDTDDDIQGSPGIVRCDSSGERIGDEVQVTQRRTSNYLDAMFAPNLFWDGRAECQHEDCPSQSAFEDPDNLGTFPIQRGGALENQAVMPPLSDVEMACEGATWAGIHERLSGAVPLALAHDIPDDMVAFIDDHGASYPAMFAAAFGDEQTSGPEDEINTRRIAFAIATHERRLRSDQTPWDAFNAGDRTALTPAQVRGYVLFRTKAECGSCHAPPLFTAHQFHFTGFFDPAWDEGRYAVTLNEGDHGKMRTPTLRNVGLRLEGGLLHNGGGRGLSLETIIDTYAAGGVLENEAIASVPVSPSVPGFELTEQEKADLIDFLLNALTDPRVLNEEPPFDRPKLGTEP